MAVTTIETHADLLAAGRKLHAHLTRKTVHPVWHLGSEEQVILLDYVSCVNRFLEHHLTRKTVHPVWQLGSEEQVILLDYVSCVNSFLEHHARDTIAHLTRKTVHPVWHFDREEQVLLLDYVWCVNRFLERHARDTLPMLPDADTLPPEGYRVATAQGGLPVMAANGLTFRTLRAANMQRLPLFRDAKGRTCHTEGDGSDWSPAQWLQAVVGELGEYANLRKKCERGDITPEEAKPMLADELADVVIYLDILAAQLGVDLGEAVMSKWNRTSEKVGAPLRIDAEDSGSGIYPSGRS